MSTARPPLKARSLEDHDESETEESYGHDSEPVVRNVELTKGVLWCLWYGCAKVNAEHLIDTYQCARRGQFLCQSIVARDLYRCHEPHVELKVAIEEPFTHHDPLSGEVWELALEAKGHNENGDVETKRYWCIHERRSKAHSLLEHEIGDDDD